MLTAERLRERLSYDPETGMFRWRVKHQGCRNVVGTIDAKGYRLIHVDGRNYRAHRLAWLYSMDKWPGEEIDHINGVRSDNRLCNLREVSSSMNKQNQRRAHKDSATGILGVRWHKTNKAYQAQLGLCGKVLHLGFFSTPEAAHDAYLAAKRELHAGNTL